MGRCPGCYGFYDIQIVAAEGPGDAPDPVQPGQVVGLDEVTAASKERISTEIVNFDRILGRDPLVGNFGIAAKAGHAIQIYGGPGAGKSTLLLQVCYGLVKQRIKVLYVAGEESLEQIKERAERLGIAKKLSPARFRLVKEQNLDDILDAMEEEEPEVIIVDSINTVEVDEYETGSIAAIKIATSEFNKLVKKYGIGLIIVTQVNKSGDFSGPKTLEHAVETSLYFKHSGGNLRTLECLTKNRHGETPAYAYFKMTEQGLVEADDPRKRDEEGEDEEEETSSLPPVPQPPPRLRSIPADGVHTPSSTLIVGEDAAIVLKVACDNCKAPVDRACTADNGAREAGFHQSRVTKSKLSLIGKEAAPPVEPILPPVEETAPVFSPDKPKSDKLTAKPRLKKSKPKPKKKSKPKPEQPSP